LGSCTVAMPLEWPLFVDALRRACKEDFVAAGTYMVWRVQQTRHPVLSEAFPAGCFVVSRRQLPDSLQEETAGCLSLAHDEGVRYGDVSGWTSLSGSTLLEDRMEPVDLAAARQMLSLVSQHRVCVTLPLLILVAESEAQERNTRSARLAFLGVRTNLERSHLHILEGIRVLRPLLHDVPSLGSLFRMFRTSQSEARMRMRYDLPLMDGEGHVEVPGTLTGPFISLVMAWKLSTKQVASSPLFQTPPPSCAAVVCVRVGSTPERSLLGKYMVQLEVLHRLTYQKADVLQSGSGSLDAESIEEAVRVFIDEEMRIATPSELEPDETSEDRPSRDFVDRLWLKVLSRCSSVACLVAAIRQVFAVLGGSGCFAPFVHKESRTEMAEMARCAVKMSMLRRYGTLSEHQTLKHLQASWDERALRFSRAPDAVSLALDTGIECLSKEFLHIITRLGFVTHQELSYFGDTQQSKAVQLDRLRCSRHLAELALVCMRHRLSFDAMRQLVLKASDHFRDPLHATGRNSHIFEVPLRDNSGSRLLSTFLSLDPSSVFVEYGDSLICALRAPASESPEAGVWRGPDSPFEYRLTLVDRYVYLP